MKKAQKLTCLLQLLDDEDETIAVEAMAEILSGGYAPDEALAELQEDSNPLIRKRIHQLQSAITMRRRRQRFYTELNSEKFSLPDGLMEVHLQWFDNDSLRELRKTWQDFADSAAKCQINSLHSLADFMLKQGMTAVSESTFQPENYCIGTIIDNSYGSAAVLCAMGKTVAANGGLDLRIVRFLSDFGLLDGYGNLLLPEKNWQTVPLTSLNDCTFWSDSEILRFASSMLFSHSVNSDSFRYIQTIAQSLTGVEDGELPETFPYPYLPAEDEEEEN